MLTFLDKITSFIAPHQCIACGIDGLLLCAACILLLPDIPPHCYRCQKPATTNQTCTSCRRQTPLREACAVTEYEGMAEKLLHGLKSDRQYAAAHTIAQTIAQKLAVDDSLLLVPIPTATSRVRQRGYDQSVEITKALARLSGVPCAKLLRRYGQQRQTGSTRAQRLKQLAGAFEVRTKQLPKDKHILLVDDVMTTGATLEAAARTLRAAGVKIISAITFARPS